MSNGETTWKDVVQSERYQDLSPEQRVRVADTFFASEVGPKLNEDQFVQGRKKFYEGVIQTDPTLTQADIGELQSPSIADYLKSPEGQRIALEVAGGMLGGVGAKALTKGVGRLKNLLTETTGVAGGSGLGSLAAEGVDPTEQPLVTAGEAALFGAGGELAGRGVGRLVLGPQASKSVVPGGRAAVRQLEGRAIPTAGQLSENSIVDLTEQVAEGSILGGKSLLKSRQKAASVAQEDIEQFVGDLTKRMSRTEAGSLAQEAVENRIGAFRATARGLFNKVDELTKNIQVDTAPITKRAGELRQELEKGLSRQAASARSLVDDVIERAEDGLSFSEAQAIRSDLAAIGRTDDPISGRAEAIAKQLSKTIDEAMTESAERLSPQGLRAFRRANKYYKKGAEVFNDQVIKQISKSHPEEVGRILAQSNKPTTIKLVKGSLKKNKRAWDAVRGNVISDWLTKSINAETGRASAGSFMQNIKNYGDDSLKALLTSEEIFNLQRFARTLSITQSKASEVGGLDVAVKLSQFGLASGFLLYGESPTAAFGILLGPTALAKILSRPKVAKRLTVGLKAPRGSREARRAFTQLSSQLTDTPGVQIFNDVPKEEIIQNTVPFERSPEVMQEPQGAS